jgi:hypothetical protein
MALQHNVNPGGSSLIAKSNRMISGESSSALVALDDLRITNRRVVRILPEFFMRTPLAEEVPALIQAHLELPQALMLRLIETAMLRRLQQLMLLIYERIDALQNLTVVHQLPSPWTRRQGDALSIGR